jgi:secreted trypsin-like serine protease
MRKLATTTTLCAAAIALGLTSAPIALATGAAPAVGTAHTAPPPHVIGGQLAPPEPWAVQVSWDSVGFQCSGTIVAPQWVLTARHCLDSGGMTVRVGANKLGEGEQATVDKKQPNPKGDMGLLHLDHPIKADYMKLANADPKASSINQIYGWGKTATDSPPSPDLRTARVKVTRLDCVDAFQGKAICSTGVDGTAYHGDSGGPQLADGVQVGVCSTGNEQDKSQQYASITANREWIRQVANV